MLKTDLSGFIERSKNTSFDQILQEEVGKREGLRNQYRHQKPGCLYREED